MSRRGGRLEVLTKAIPGFAIDSQANTFVISGDLESKLMRWKEEDRIEREEEERRRSRRPWANDDMDVDDENGKGKGRRYVPRISLVALAKLIYAQKQHPRRFSGQVQEAQPYLSAQYFPRLTLSRSPLFVSV